MSELDELMARCKHYNGIRAPYADNPGRCCDAGVVYSTVTASEDKYTRITFPCIKHRAGKIQCLLAEFPSKESFSGRIS